MLPCNWPLQLCVSSCFAVLNGRRRFFLISTNPRIFQESESEKTTLYRAALNKKTSSFFSPLFRSRCEVMRVSQWKEKLNNVTMIPMVNWMFFPAGARWQRGQVLRGWSSKICCLALIVWCTKGGVAGQILMILIGFGKLIDIQTANFCCILVFQKKRPWPMQREGLRTSVATNPVHKVGSASSWAV